MLTFIGLALVATLSSASPIVLPTYNASSLPHLQTRQGASGWGSNGAGGCSISQALATNVNDASPGDGDPHQNYWHVQLSETISCGNGGCSVGETETESVTIGFSFGTNSNFKPGQGVVNWFQAGFSVSETWTTGNQYTCNGNPNGKVSIWQTVGHTAYSVANTPSGNCGYDNSDYETYVNVYASPNDNNQGGGFYCVRDDTPDGGNNRNKGDGYWEGGCAGGPQAYCGSGGPP